jgi:tetratricopeptide (TPR) repeat protein
VSKRLKKKRLSQGAQPQGGAAAMTALSRASPEEEVRWGLSAFERGDYEEAIQAWQRARRAGASTAIDRALAEAYFRGALHDSHLARRTRHLHEAVVLAPGNSTYLFHLGLAYHRQGQPRRAADAFEAAHRLAPADDRVRRHLVLALLADSDPAAAERARELLVTAKPGDEATARLRALAALRARNPGEAVAALDAIKSPSPLVTLALGLTYLAAGQLEAAEAALSRVQRSRRPLSGEARCAATLATMAARMRAGDQIGTTKGLDGLELPVDARLRSTLAYACRRLAVELALEERFPEAVAALERGATAEPGQQATRRALAHLREVAATQAARRGDHAAAAQLWGAVLAEEPGNTRVLHNLALAEERLGRWQQAAARWEELVQRWKKDLHATRSAEGTAELRRRLAVAYAHLAETTEAAGDFRAAPRTLERALNFDPSNDDLRLRAAELYLDNDEYGPAIEHLRRVLGSRPDDARVLLELGSAYDLKGDDQRAEEYLQQALSLEPDNPAVTATLASVYHGRGDRLADSGGPGRALAEYQRATALDPTNAEHYVCSGEAHLKLGQLKAAEAAFKHAFALRPKDSATLISVAQAYLSAGYAKQADRVFRQALRHDRSTLMRAIVGLAHLRAGNPAGAQPHLKQVLDGRDPLAVALVSKALLSRGREAEAVPYLERAVELSPWSAEAHIDLAHAYAFSLGDSERALAELTEAQVLAEGLRRQDLLAELAEAHQALRYMADPNQLERDKPWLRW